MPATDLREPTQFFKGLLANCWLCESRINRKFRGLDGRRSFKRILKLISRGEVELGGSEQVQEALSLDVAPQRFFPVDSFIKSNPQAASCAAIRSS